MILTSVDSTLFRSPENDPLSKRFSIGLIGCRFGAHVAREMVKDTSNPFRIAKVCDLNSELAISLAEEINCVAETDYRKLLADPSLSAIGLFTGPNGRAKFLHEILLSGKDVMTTKPFEIDPEQAKWILKEAKGLGRVIHLNSPSPQLGEDLSNIKRWNQEYNLGQPAYFFSSTHASYFENRDGSWYDDPVRCPAAPIFRLGIYLINDIFPLLGAPRSMQLVETRVRTGRPTADNAVLTLEMENNAVGSIAASFCVEDGDHYRNSLQISYERGTIYRDFGPQRSNLHPLGQLNLVQPGSHSTREIRATYALTKQTNAYDWEYFAKAMQEKNSLTDEYADRIMGGVEIFNQVAHLSGKTSPA